MTLITLQAAYPEASIESIFTCRINDILDAAAMQHGKLAIRHEQVCPLESSPALIRPNMLCQASLCLHKSLLLVSNIALLLPSLLVSAESRGMIESTHLSDDRP